MRVDLEESIVLNVYYFCTIGNHPKINVRRYQFHPPLFGCCSSEVIDVAWGGGVISRDSQHGGLHRMAKKKPYLLFRKGKPIGYLFCYSRVAAQRWANSQKGGGIVHASDEGVLEEDLTLPVLLPRLSRPKLTTFRRQVTITGLRQQELDYLSEGRSASSQVLKALRSHLSPKSKKNHHGH